MYACCNQFPKRTVFHDATTIDKLVSSTTDDLGGEGCGKDELPDAVYFMQSLQQGMRSGWRETSYTYRPDVAKMEMLCATH